MFPQATAVMVHKYWCVSWSPYLCCNTLQREWWAPVQGVSCSSFFFSSPSYRVGGANLSTAPRQNFHICIYTRSEQSRHSTRTAPHTVVVYMNPTFIFHRKGTNKSHRCLFSIFSVFRLHLKPFYEKTVAPEQISFLLPSLW